jgi:hypothetical protein
MDYDKLNTCFSGDESKSLQKKFENLTPSDHKYVPWVVIDGTQWTGSSTWNLIHNICKAYTGTNKPAGCTQQRDYNDWNEEKAAPSLNLRRVSLIPEFAATQQ